MGYAEMLSSSERDGKAARIVGEQAERCRAIVRSLSALAGQSLHPFQELGAKELVERMARGLTLGQAPDSPTLRIAPIGALRLCADRVGLEQVLTNLVVNALQASPRGGEVLLSVSERAEGVEFCVSDCGPGVPLERRHRLFEPFFTTKAPGEGTGLGLAIADAIVRGHGGKIAVEDRPGGSGALFRVLLPHARADKTPRIQPPSSTERERCVLIVDDDAAVRSVLRSQAERRGWSVREAESAEVVLSDLERLQQADAVVCDLRMPGIGGIGLYDHLQREAPQTLARFVFITGDLASEESARFSMRCERPLVQKPFDFDELFSILSRAVPRVSAMTQKSAPG
jgi:CheY-like chemotaxis protein/anti-sigma regulatory factor (Ser/Thr protein kinase)